VNKIVEIEGEVDRGKRLNKDKTGQSQGELDIERQLSLRVDFSGESIGCIRLSQLHRGREEPGLGLGLSEIRHVFLCFHEGRG
jgi:hypothetical protein